MTIRLNDILVLLTCSYAINLMADSGAILATLMPLPLHSDRNPPSLTITRKPVTIPKLLLVDPCTYKHIKHQ